MSLSFALILPEIRQEESVMLPIHRNGRIDQCYPFTDFFSGKNRSMLPIHRLIFWEESVVIWDVGFAIITGVATRTELKQFVKRLEYAGLVGVFDVEAGELPGSRLRDDIRAGNIQVSLAVKGTNRQIETYKDLAEVHTLIKKTNRN
jgi:hypothetical protein